jgi:YebC/PmpR family DNA-binding regulatory protein
MSGHSKWSTIKHKKQAEDIARGKLFSKLSKAISIAVKTGGGKDPDTNSKLRMAIDQAKDANMPKDNIERAINKGSGEGQSLEEVVYEGYGPDGIAVIVETATDNKNRTAQEIKNIFDRVGGNLAGPGAVSYNFEPKGLILVQKKDNVENQILELIDLGVDDVEETDEGIEAYVPTEKTSSITEKIKKSGNTVKSSSLVQKPKIVKQVTDESSAKRILKWLNQLDDHEDVQKIFVNIDIPEEIVQKASTL